MNRCELMMLAAVLLGCASAVSGQPSDEGRASPYFDCPYVNYFDTDCPQLRDRRPPLQGRQASPEPQPGQGLPRKPGDTEDSDATRREVLPDELILFPRESLAPDAPPLFRLLLADPTLANARRYVRWHARRSAQLQVVQALIQRAGEELKTNPALAPGPVDNGQ